MLPTLFGTISIPTLSPQLHVPIHSTTSARSAIQGGADGAAWYGSPEPFLVPFPIFMFHHVRDWFQRKSPRNDPFLVPLELVFSDVLKNGPPEKVFSEDRFRVGVYRELCRTTQKTPAVFWLDLQFRNQRKRKWESMVCMHDSRLEIMLRVLGDAVAYTQQQKKRGS